MPAPPAYARIVEDVRNRIAAGELRSGDQLPRQADMAAQWHTSLQPVRQALLLLEAEGLIESRQGVGAFVR